MGINKDDIRKFLHTPRVVGLPRDSALALLASDDAKDETIQQQAEEITKMQREFGLLEQMYEDVKKDKAKQAAEIERLREENTALCPIGNFDVVTSLRAELAHAEEARKAAEAEIERLTSQVRALERDLQTVSDFEIIQRLKAAERERDEARKSRGEWLRMSFELGQYNAALRECLAWYADKKNNEWDVDSFSEITHSEVMKDDGERARTLLAELDREDEQPKEGKNNANNQAQ